MSTVDQAYMLMHVNLDGADWSHYFRNLDPFLLMLEGA